MRRLAAAAALLQDCGDHLARLGHRVDAVDDAERQVQTLAHKGALALRWGHGRVDGGRQLPIYYFGIFVQCTIYFCCFTK